MKNDAMQNHFVLAYDQFSDAIFRFSVTRVSSREQALDITQETFTRFWRSLRDGADIKNNKVYLFTIAHRLIIDWYRKKKPVSLEGLAQGSDGESEPYEPIDEGAGQSLELDAEGRYLLSSLKKMKPSGRHILHLRFVEGFSIKEIGDVLGISDNAVSVRINRGLAELRSITGYVITENK